MALTPETNDRRILTTAAAQQTQALAQRLGRLSAPGDWIGLTGDLGAGKTCFVQGLAAGLDVPAETAVTSPTFVLLQTYPGRCPLHHLDLYRLGDADELFEIGYDDLLAGEGVCAVEWCDQIPAAIPADGLLIALELIDETSRRIHLGALGPRGLELLHGLDQVDASPFEGEADPP